MKCLVTEYLQLTQFSESHFMVYTWFSELTSSTFLSITPALPAHVSYHFAPGSRFQYKPSASNAEETGILRNRTSISAGKDRRILTLIAFLPPVALLPARHVDDAQR